jgi:hypothetical protein
MRLRRWTALCNQPVSNLHLTFVKPWLSLARGLTLLDQKPSRSRRPRRSMDTISKRGSLCTLKPDEAHRAIILCSNEDVAVGWCLSSRGGLGRVRLRGLRRHVGRLMGMKQVGQSGKASKQA